jgi:DNA-binding NtrC family response regulator
VTTEKRRILVVEDDRHMCNSVLELLQRKGYAVRTCSNGAEALQCFGDTAFDCIISDIKMPIMTGDELLEKIKGVNKTVPFIIMTAYGEVTMAVDAMKKGAYDFIEKGPELLSKLEYAVARALQHHRLLNENIQLKNVLRKQWQYVGKTSRIEDIRLLIDNIAQSRSTVLVTGESGTGKELIARSIHFLSNRQNEPFVKVNCAALPDGLIESELFGHEKGAFTGALKAKAGKFELASGGTLLLDEIGEMPNNLQAKLLRVLQEREINKVGGDEPIAVDVRIVATSNRDLEAKVQENCFREDLYYRLNVFHVKLPPLRERMDDVPFLVGHFIEKYNDENGFSVSGIEDAALKTLQAHTWPGNIRELENAIERAVVLTRSGKIQKDVFELKKTLEGKNEGLTPGMTVAEAEKQLILQTLEFCNQNRTRAAEMLGISIRTLRNKLNEYGVSKE